MLNAILSWLSGGVATKLIEAYKAKLDAGNDADRIAADFAAKEVEARTKIVTAQLSNWFTALPIWTISMCMALYIAKLIVWDKMLGLGSTDPLTGDLREWAQTILASMFGYGAVGLTAKAFLRR